MDWSNDTNGGAPVIELNAAQTKARFAPLAQIEAYWTALRGTRLMPQRSEIDPRGLKGALEYCFVLERIAPGLARLRVAGTHLSDLMGMEVRGMPISAFLTADSREEFGKALEEVFESPAVATIELTADAGFGRPALRARMQLMPVRSDLGDSSRILGGFITEGEIGRAPRRFKVESIKLTRVTGSDAPAKTERLPLAPDAFASAQPPKAKPSSILPRFTRKTSAPETPARGMAEASTEFEQPIAGVPYLRVVK